MADDIGSVKGITGTSMGLNTAPGQGGQKPSASAGKSDPGGTKPTRPAEPPVPMPR